MTNVTIGNNVKTIGDGAFSACSALKSIEIPDSVETIGAGAFSDCGIQKSITISKNVTAIGEACFSGCGFLNEINVDEYNENYKSVDGVLFNKDMTKIIAYPAGKEGGYTIPDSVTSIESSAFSGCSGLTEITIPDSVTSIGSSAFERCSGLTEITIPNSVTLIESNAFEGCSRLTEITIPNSVTSIGSSAFSGCSGLTSVTIPDSVTSIESYAFYGCSGLTGITIPDNVTSIGSSAFSGCSGLTEITIPDSVTSIGSDAFERCTGLTSVTIPDSVTSIDSDAFGGCTGLNEINVGEGNKNYKSVEGVLFNSYLSTIISYPGGREGGYVIPDSVWSIESCAFEGCTGLTEITIPNSVTSIESSAFNGCTGLTSVTIPDSVTSIDSDAFGGCTGLNEINVGEGNKNYKSVEGVLFNSYLSTIISYPGGREGGYVIPDSVWSIESCAFEGCTGLTEITIPNSVTSIESSAFNGCTGLTSITIPGSVTTIEYSAFEGCTGLTSITIPNSVTTIRASSFRNCTGLNEINVEGGNKNYRSADGVLFNKDMTEIIKYPSGKKGGYVIPDSVTQIGSGVFDGCTGLTSITIPESVTSIGSYTFNDCTGLNEIIVDEENKHYKSVDGVLFNKNMTMIITYPLGKKGGYVIPDSVTGLGYDIFAGHTELTSITIPNSVTNIGYYAFVKCTGLTSVTLPDSITTIGFGTFLGCTGLKSVTIPDSVKTIGMQSFCFTGLTSVIIPENVTVIGLGAFSACNDLNSVTILSRDVNIGAYAFGYTEGNDDVDIVKIDSFTVYGYPGSTAEKYAEENGFNFVDITECQHTETELRNVKDATCTEKGYTGDKVCMECGEVLETGTEISVLGHSFENYISDNNATCTKDGTKTAKCERCDVTDTLTDVGSATGHTLVTDEAVVPTCTKTGLTEGSHCSVCGEIIVKQEIVSALGHDFSDEWTIDTAPSCTESGLKSHHCSRCDEKSDITVVEAAGHNYGDWIISSESSCPDTGIKYRECSVCGDRETQCIDKTEHEYGEWVVIKEANVLSDGLNQRTCKNCGNVESVVLPSLKVDIEKDHSYGLANFTVVNAQTLQPIENANIFISTANDGENTFSTDENGKVSVILPVGTQHISVYANGCLTRNISIKIESGVNEIPQIGLSDKPVYEAKVTHHLMTADEIEEAGIDVSSEDNNHTYKYELTIEFEPEVDWVSIAYYWGESGKIYGGSGTVNGEPVVWNPDGYFIVPREDEDPMCIYPVSEYFYLIIRGDVRWLKEMFDVEMLVINNSNTDTLEDLTATLNLPDGLSLADMSGEQQTLAQEIGNVDYSSTKSVHWYVRGDKAGSYPIEARLRGKVMPFDEEIDDIFRAENSLQVLAGNALNLNFEFPNAAYYGEDYPITITLTNVSDITLYNVSHMITGIKQGRVTYYSNGTKEQEVYMDTDTIGGDFAKEFKPGDKIVMELSVNILFESKLMEYKLQKLIGIVDGVEQLMDAYKAVSMVVNAAELLDNSVSGCAGALDKFTSGENWDSAVTGDDKAEKIKLFNTLHEKIAGLSTKYGTSGNSMLNAAFNLTNTSLGQSFNVITNDSETWLKNATVSDIEKLINQVSAVENNLTGSESKSRKFDIYDSIRTAISAIPIRYVLTNVFMTEDEDNTTSIPWTYSVSEASPRYFGVSSVSKYLMSLVIAACGETYDSSMPSYLKLIPGIDDPLNYDDAVKYIQATEDEIALVKAKDATGEIKFKCWIESAEGESDSIQNDFILECDNETAVFENGALTFTGDGLINITPKTTNGGKLHIEDSEGNTYIYEINVVEQHECTAGEREVIVSPTNDYEGFAVKCCSVCGEIMDIETLSVSECSSHSFGEWTVETQATCSACGIRTRSCSECGYTETEYTDASDSHTEEVRNDVSATCTQDGYTGDVYCSVCGELLENGTVIPALDHSYGEWTKLDDSQHQRVCANDENHVEKSAHSWDGGAVTKTASCSEEGILTYTCSVCHAEKTEIIPKTAHTQETISGFSATCTQTGLTDGVKCSVCGEIITAQEIIPALGHEDGDNDGICDICGEEAKIDTDCDTAGHVDSDKDGICDGCGDIMPEVKSCKCICHKKGIAKIFYKIFRFIWKIFGMKKTCGCGLEHY